MPLIWVMVIHSPMFEFPKQFTLISASNVNDKHFIAFLLKIKDHLKLHTPIDNLAKHEKKKDLYNQGTYVDFHLILCESLELLLGSLAELKAIHLRLKGKVPSLTQLCNIMEKIDFIAVVGTVLQLLVKSQVIKKCLIALYASFLIGQLASMLRLIRRQTTTTMIIISGTEMMRRMRMSWRGS